MKGIFFDLGGTLFSYSNIGQGAAPLLVEATRRLGLDLALEDMGAAYWQANREISVIYAQKDYYLHAHMFRDTFRRFVQLLEAEFKEDIYDWYRAEQHRVVVETLELKHDCIETLEQLKDRELYLSIVSNIDEDTLQPLVEREGLHRYFEHWTSSEAARSCKPHSRFFEVSLDKAGLEAEEVLFVGDSPEHDVGGASALGMRTVLIVQEGVTPPMQSGKPTPEPDHEITHLAELPDLVPG